MIGRNNGRPRQVLPTFTMQPIQNQSMPTPTPAPAPALALALAPQMPTRPMGNQASQERAKAIYSVTHASDAALPHPD
jgi:hypothetical protein